jgi:alkyl hydroperoxide reductase subunit AhpC
VRNVVIGPEKKVKLILVYPGDNRRNFDEVLRVIDLFSSPPSTRLRRP